MRLLNNTIDCLESKLFYHSLFHMVSIHPRYKQDVARRLEVAARAVAYNDKTVKYQGPFPKTVSEDKAHNTLHIVYNHGPIEVKNNDGFEVNNFFLSSLQCQF